MARTANPAAGTPSTMASAGTGRVTRNATRHAAAHPVDDRGLDAAATTTTTTSATTRPARSAATIAQQRNTSTADTEMSGYSHPHTRSHTHSHSHSHTNSHTNSHRQDTTAPVPAAPTTSSTTATPTSIADGNTAGPGSSSSRGYTPPLTRSREKIYMTYNDTTAPTTTTVADDGFGTSRSDEKRRYRTRAAGTGTASDTATSAGTGAGGSHLHTRSNSNTQSHAAHTQHTHSHSTRPSSRSGSAAAGGGGRISAHGHRPVTRGLLPPISQPQPSPSQYNHHDQFQSSASTFSTAPTSAPTTAGLLNSRHTSHQHALTPEAEMETDRDATPTNGHVLRNGHIVGRGHRYHTRRSRTPEPMNGVADAGMRMDVDPLRGLEHEVMAASAGAGAGPAAGSSARARTPENGRSGSGTSGTGGGSIRKRQRVYGDRFIPNRDGQDLQASYSLLGEDGGPTTPSKSRRRPQHGELHFQKVEEANRTYSRVLRNEVFGDSVPQVDVDSASPDVQANNSAMRTPPSYKAALTLPPASITPSTPSKNLFSYAANRASGSLTPSRTPRGTRGDGGVGDGGGSAGAGAGAGTGGGGGGGGSSASNMNMQSDIYSLSPIRLESQRILQSAKKQPRYINRVPYKVLDAPDLADDFYLNLVDWGSSNIVGVGLADSVYMWDSQSGDVTRLCQLANDTVTSVSWIQRGTHLAIGTNKGFVQIWDAQQQRRLRTMTGHTMRVGALAWNDHILTSGSRDRIIYHRDVRSSEQHVRTLTGHTQEVCGLKWNTEDGQLASGGNDNNLMVWDKLYETPLHRFADHTAAVKAIAWSPHRRHLLASGGGTADRTIKFWNTATGQLIKDVDTGSQVCNLAWSQNSDEIVSTHGYSQNQIVVWKYPRMEQIVSLTGHTFRVLYLAMSPDGQSIVTGAGDETLRFWKIFNKRNGGEGRESRLISSAVIR